MRGGEAHAYPQAQAPGRPGPRDRQGRLTPAPAEARVPSAPQQPGQRRWRLEHGVEIFDAPDGDIYILGGLQGDAVIQEPTADERDVLLALQDGVPAEHAVARCSEPAAMLRDLWQAGVLEAFEQPPTTVPLTAEQSARFDRQMAYFADMQPGRELELQGRLHEAIVVILGVGGLGSWTAAALACAGIGSLLLVDDDTVELSNLNRQLLFARSDVGRPKVQAAADALGRFNPELNIETRQMRMASTGDVASLLDGAHFVVETADSPIYSIGRWVNDACTHAGIPHISAGQFPPFIRIGPTFVPGQTACLECQERQTRQAFKHYDTLVSFRQAHPRQAATLGPASGSIGSMIAMDVCHYLTGIAAPGTLGRSITVDLRDWTIVYRDIDRDPYCPRCCWVSAPQA